jgi:phosphoglycolate phosphatase
MEGMRNVVFDLDGTLVDTSEGVVNGVKHLFRELDRAAPDDAEIARRIGPPLRDMLVTLLGTEDDAELREGIRVFREYYRDHGAAESRPYAGVPQLLRSLADAGLRLMIVTNKPTAFARAILERLSMASLFEEILGQELSGAPAEKSDLLADLIRTHRLETRGTVMIGDTAGDVEAARANGVRSIGVTWGYGLPAAVERAAPDAVCYSVEHLRRVLLTA